jgi:hypothetical protein
MSPTLYAAAGLLGMSLVGISVEPAASECPTISADLQRFSAAPCEVQPAIGKIACGWPGQPGSNYGGMQSARAADGTARQLL